MHCTLYLAYEHIIYLQMPDLPPRCLPTITWGDALATSRVIHESDESAQVRPTSLLLPTAGATTVYRNLYDHGQIADSRLLGNSAGHRSFSGSAATDRTRQR